MLPRIPVTLYAVRRRRLAGGRQPILMLRRPESRV